MAALRHVKHQAPAAAEASQHALEIALQNYGARSYVTGIDIGFKYFRGRRTGKLAVRVHVIENGNQAVLDPNEIFPSTINGLPLNVLQGVYRVRFNATGRMRERTVRRNAIQPGLGVSRRGGSVGTLGAIVFDRSTGAPCLLSNWHVLARGNAVQIGDHIVQPGASNRTKPIATLERWVIGSDGDAAIGRLSTTRRVKTAQFGTSIRVMEARFPQLGDEVIKSSSRTGITRGRVDGIGRYYMQFGDQRFGVDGFKITSRIDGNPGNVAISAMGDSGSLWYVESDGVGVGLHFAGDSSSNPRNEYALACFLPRVLEALDVTLTCPGGS
jgi:hypothetical protein